MIILHVGARSSTRKAAVKMGTSSVPVELQICFATDFCGSRDGFFIAYGIPKDWDLVMNEHVFLEWNYLSLCNQLWIPPE